MGEYEAGFLKGATLVLRTLEEEVDSRCRLLSELREYSSKLRTDSPAPVRLDSVSHAVDGVREEVLTLKRAVFVRVCRSLLEVVQGKQVDVRALNFERKPRRGSG